jgi:hypothetical protein
MFCPTMITGSSTSWKKVWAIQETMTMRSWDWMASGKLTNAIPANR